VSFFKIARNAAAAEYGRVRAEQYGRRAKGLSALGCLAALVLVLAIIAAAQGAFGG
jgi:hypothetical protein